MKAIKQVLQKDKEKYRVPKRVQDLIPIKRIWNDGIFLVGTVKMADRVVREMMGL